MQYYILGTVFLLLVLWMSWSMFSRSVETLSYAVLEVRDGYEIRRYPPHIVAEAVVDGEFGRALNSGFMIIAPYIFGANAPKEKIAMTAPVIETSAPRGTEIAMTAPVIQATRDGARMVQFVMPVQYTMDTLPQPTDARVVLREVPERVMAAHRFSWYYTAERIATKKAVLQSMLERDGISMVGEPQFAGYNDPWTIPFLFKNEILIEIKP